MSKSEAEEAFQKHAFCCLFSREFCLIVNLFCNTRSSLKTVRKDTIYFRKIVDKEHIIPFNTIYSKTCLNRPLKKKTKIDFQDRLSLNAGQKFLQNAPREYSAILLTFIKLQFVFKTFILSIFE